MRLTRPITNRFAHGLRFVVPMAGANLLFTVCVAAAQPGSPDATNFNWRQFGQRVIAGADARTRQRIAQSSEERARFIAAEVGRQLHALGVPPNTTYVERGVAWKRLGSQDLGTCQHVTEALKDAMAGAGIDERRLLRVYGDKGGAAQLNIFDVNRNHVALAYIREDGRIVSYDLWAHGGDHKTFDGFEQSVWNGQDAVNWSKVMEKHGFGWQACFDCADSDLRAPYFLLEALEKQAAIVASTAPPGAVRFIVKNDRGGEPLVNARVIVSGYVDSPVEHIRVVAATDESGAANVSGILPGPYAVTTSHANCPAFTSGATHLEPGEVRTIRMVCGAQEQDQPPEKPAQPSKKVPGLFDEKPAPSSRSGGPAVSGDAQIVAEYRSLLPGVLEAEKKPWHTRIDIRANAVPEGSAFHVNYQTYCLIETGTDKGKDHICYEYNATLTAGELRTAVADFKRRLGR